MPDPVSLKKVLKESSDTEETALSLGSWPSGWMPCSMQYSSLKRYHNVDGRVLNKDILGDHDVDDLPAGVAHLDTGLTDMDGDTFPHLGLVGDILKWRGESAMLTTWQESRE